MIGLLAHDDRNVAGDLAARQRIGIAVFRQAVSTQCTVRANAILHAQNAIADRRKGEGDVVTVMDNIARL